MTVYISDYLANKILNKALRNADFSVVTPYVSAHTADPGGTGASEGVGGSYARVAGTFDAPSSRATANTDIIDFEGMPAATITHVGVWDAASGGNFLFGGPLAVAKTTNAGDTFRLPSGDLDIGIPT